MTMALVVKPEEESVELALLKSEEASSTAR